MKYLVTGAGGSIGSEIVRHLSLLKPDKIVLVGHSETAIYAINQEVPRSIPVIADIRNLARMREIFLEHSPDVVFHAAAMKHVPLAEQFPAEAVQTNIIGTRNVAIASQMVGAQMIFISTDKAVYPSSVMGKTKRIAELYCATHDHIKTVRFGNVIGSSGSVYPLFQKQIEAGGPVTVTHPDMVRYFMTAWDAARLALYAASEGFPHTLYVPAMAKRRILDIAKELIGSKGITITITGLRPGEKLDESLFYDSEVQTVTNNVCHLSYAQTRDATILNQTVSRLESGDMSILESFVYA